MPASQMTGPKQSSEELLNEAIGTVYDKLRHVNHSMHIVALSQELRELIGLRREMGYDRK